MAMSCQHLHNGARVASAWECTRLVRNRHSGSSLHTNAGDVTSLLEHFFDTSVGEKKTAPSYRTISEQIGLPPQHILFLSDAERGLDAAASAGFRTAHIVRPGTNESACHPVHPDLGHLLLE